MVKIYDAWKILFNQVLENYMARFETKLPDSFTLGEFEDSKMRVPLYLANKNSLAFPKNFNIGWDSAYVAVATELGKAFHNLLNPDIYETLRGNHQGSSIWFEHWVLFKSLESYCQNDAIRIRYGLETADKFIKKPVEINDLDMKGGVFELLSTIPIDKRLYNLVYLISDNISYSAFDSQEDNLKKIAMMGSINEAVDCFDLSLWGIHVLLDEFNIVLGMQQEVRGLAKEYQD